VHEVLLTSWHAQGTSLSTWLMRWDIPGGNMHRCNVRCSAVQIVRCTTMQRPSQCTTMQYNAVQNSTMQHNAGNASLQGSHRRLWQLFEDCPDGVLHQLFNGVLSCILLYGLDQLRHSAATRDVHVTTAGNLPRRCPRRCHHSVEVREHLSSAIVLHDCGPRVASVAYLAPRISVTVATAFRCDVGVRSVISCNLAAVKMR
jgi:hypothetical protein